MKYLAFLTALLLSTPTLAEEESPFFLGPKPVLCGPLAEILKAVEGVNEVPYAYWYNPDEKTTNVMYISPEGGVTVVESFINGNACIIGAGQNLTFFDKPTKTNCKGNLTMKGQHVIYKK